MLRPIYFSVKTRQQLADRWRSFDQLDDDGVPKGMGNAHYTYRIVARRFIKLFAQQGLSARELDMPELFEAQTLPHKAGAQKPLHLIFKPAEEIRIIRGAYNVGIVYWEFDTIATVSGKHGPATNQRRMLGLLDEIWVANSYTKATFEHAGLRNVHIVPCPVDIQPSTVRAPLVERFGQIESVRLRQTKQPPSIVPLERSLRDGGSDTGAVFLSVLNPMDERKDAESLVRAFKNFKSASGPQPTLLIKLIIDNDKTRLLDVEEFISGQLGFKPAENTSNIVLISQAFADGEMSDLYRSCPFFISVARAEGQNLPLLEAISGGCLPVAPDHTAMSDYISRETAVVVPSTRKRADAFSNALASSGFSWFQSAPSDIEQCIDAALQLEDAVRAEIIRNAQEMVVTKFGPRRIWQSIAARLDLLHA